MNTTSLADVAIVGGERGEFYARIAAGRLLFEHDGISIDVTGQLPGEVARKLFVPFKTVRIDLDPSVDRPEKHGWGGAFMDVREHLRRYMSLAANKGVKFDELPPLPEPTLEDFTAADAIAVGEDGSWEHDPTDLDARPTRRPEDFDDEIPTQRPEDLGYELLSLNHAAPGGELGSFFAFIAGGRLLFMFMNETGRGHRGKERAWDVTDESPERIAKQLFSRYKKVEVATSSSIDFPHEDGWRKKWMPIERLDESLRIAATLGVERPVETDELVSGEAEA